MATSVTLPARGESVTEGTVTRWLKQPGDKVSVDEPLLEVSTDTVDTEIPSPVAGTLLEIKAEEDETVEVGAELAIIGSGDAAPATSDEPEPEPEAKEEPEPEPRATVESAPEPEPEAKEEPKQEAPKQEAPKQEAPKQEAPAPAAAAPSEGGRDQSAYVTPLVRKMADQHGIDLGSVQGTGVGGRI